MKERQSTSDLWKCRCRWLIPTLGWSISLKMRSKSGAHREVGAVVPVPGPPYGRCSSQRQQPLDAAIGAASPTERMRPRRGARRRVRRGFAAACGGGHAAGHHHQRRLQPLGQGDMARHLFRRRLLPPPPSPSREAECGVHLRCSGAGRPPAPRPSACRNRASAPRRARAAPRGAAPARKPARGRVAEAGRAVSSPSLPRVHSGAGQYKGGSKVHPAALVGALQHGVAHYLVACASAKSGHVLVPLARPPRKSASALIKVVFVADRAPRHPQCSM